MDLSRSRITNIIISSSCLASISPNVVDCSNKCRGVHLSVRIWCLDAVIIHKAWLQVGTTADQVIVCRGGFILPWLALFEHVIVRLTDPHFHIDLSIALNIRIEAQELHELQF